MRNRWFHAPRLHTAASTTRTWSWLAMFYDLLLAAAVLQLGSLLTASVERGEGLFGFARVGGHFVPLWLAWTGFTFYENRFDVDDFVHRAIAFTQMIAVAGMAISAPAALSTTPDHRPFALSAAVAIFLVVIMQARAHGQVPEARDYTRFWGRVFGASSLLFAVSAWVPRPWCYLMWAAGSVGILMTPLFPQSRALTERFPLDLRHLSGRYGLLTMIVLGASFVSLLGDLAQGGQAADPAVLLKGLLALLTTIAIWWIYFDDVAGSQIRTSRGSWIIWLYGHLPLAFAIAALSVAIRRAVALELGTVPDPRYAWYVAGALGLTFLCVGVIDSVTERRQAELSDRARVNLRFVSALLMIVVAQIGTSLTTGVFLAVIAAVCVGQVLFDMVMVPMEETQAMSGTSVAATAREQRGNMSGGTGRREKRADLADAVRIGAPDDLRRDLYFFFIEGSWTRMIATLVVCYLIINFVFAGAYLLEPASIGVEDRTAFLEAFSFSVQTMSTIGYGAISPKTPYGDLVVTIEAAVGLLGVALATGLMFAKASLPRSSVLFSDSLIVTQKDGVPTLMFRCGNARGNEVVEATINVAVIRDEISPEGHHLRRVLDLPLVRHKSPIFTLSWVVMHPIDEDSPLADVDWSKPEDHVVVFIATMLGHDATYGSTTHARYTYYPENVLVGQRFVDVISELDDGRLMIDYTKFHDTEPDDTRPVDAASDD